MKSKLFKNIAALLFCCPCFLATAQSTDTLRIVCFGNSTTALRKGVEKVYPLRLKEHLAAAGLPSKIWNAGLSGSHSGSLKDNNFHKITHAKDRFEWAVLPKNPDWVVIWFGINDAWQDKGRDSSERIPLSNYIENLTFFIEKIEKQGGRVVLLSPNPIGKKYETWRFEKLKTYAEATQKLAIERRVVFVDVWHLFQNTPEQSGHSPLSIDSLLLDGMHPNDSGQALVADAIFKIIQNQSHVGETFKVSPTSRSNTQNAQNTEGGITSHVRETSKVSLTFLDSKITTDSIWLAPKVEDMAGQKMGPFTRLKNGDLLTVDTTNAYLSADNGKNWTTYPIFPDPKKFAIRPERALICTKNGVVILAFANDKERSVFNWQDSLHDALNTVLPTYAVRSLDGGKTWTDLQKLHDDWTGAIRDIIETRDGDVVFTTMMMRHKPGHHTVLTYNTNDDGKTWTRSNIIDLGGIGHHSGVTEATLTQLEDGRLWMLMRTNWKVLWETFSNNNGLTWTDFKATTIDASSAPALIKRLRSGRLVLVWNRYFPEGKTDYPLRGGDNQWSEVPVSNHREELSIAFSDTEGRTWSKPVVFAKTLKGRGQISYPYIFENTEGGKTISDFRFQISDSAAKSEIRNPKFTEGGEIWITTMFGGLRVRLHEADFFKKQLCESCQLSQSLKFGMRLRQKPSNFEAIHAPTLLKTAPANESTIVRLKTGELKIYFINRPGRADKLMSIASKNNGETWSEPQKEFDLGGEAYYANQVFEDKNGTLHAIFHRYGTGDKGYRGRHLDLWYSQKETGKNWETPRPIWSGYVGSLRGFIQLKNGRLLIPMSEADPQRAQKPAAGSTDFGLFSVICLYSDDLGKTWQQTEQSLKIPVESSQVTRYGAVEPNIIGLKDGRVWLLIRTNKGHLYESFSTDFGKTWSEPAASSFISSDSPAWTVRLSDGSIALFFSSNQRYDDPRSYANGGREVLHAAISKDEGKTWAGFREVLVSPPSVQIRGDRGAAYPSVIEAKNGKLVVVAGQGEERSVLAFDPKWLLEKKAKDDFSQGLVQWTLFGVDSLVSLERVKNQTVLKIDKPKATAVWNFSMDPKGELQLKIEPKQGKTTVLLALTDHFSVSNDSLASKNALVQFSVAISKTSMVSIKWDARKGKAALYVNRHLVAEKPFLRSVVHGLNYLRLGIEKGYSVNLYYAKID